MFLRVAHHLAAGTFSTVVNFLFFGWDVCQQTPPFTVDTDVPEGFAVGVFEGAAPARRSAPGGSVGTGSDFEEFFLIKEN